MKTFKFVLASFCLVVLFNVQASTLSVDSLGLKKENNKTFLVYKIGAKQSLYHVLKRFNLSLTEFKEVNPEITIPVNTGELVFIPLHYLDESTNTLGNVNKPAEKPAEPVETQKNSGIHIVSAKQSLLTVANLYKVTMAEIRKWNNLTSDVLKEGQRLIVSAPTANNIDKSTLLPQKGSEEAKNPSQTPEQAETNGMRKTIETGMAELIDVPDNSGKYLALHKTAPIGTLVLVKNLANGQSIWVKVIGRLPNADNKLIIKLSPKAFERLNAVDKRIRAEISYLVK